MRSRPRAAARGVVDFGDGLLEVRAEPFRRASVCGGDEVVAGPEMVLHRAGGQPRLGGDFADRRVFGAAGGQQGRRARGRLAENIDWIGVILAIGLGALFLVTDWAPPGFALLAIAVCSIGGRIVLDFDEDTEYEALKKEERRRRIERIEATGDPGAGV